MRRLTLPLLAAAVATVVSQVPAGLAQDKKDPPRIKDNVLAQIEKALPDKAPATPKKPRNLLVFSKTAGFRHGSIPVGVRAVTLMGDKTGAYTAFATEDESYFEPEKLAKFDAVLMLNTTGEVFRTKLDPKADDAAKKAAAEREERLKASLRDFVASGKGLVGFHAATDTYHNWKEYNRMMGGTFAGHPWNAGSKVTIRNLDPKHPLNAPFEGEGFDVTDEIYQFRADTAVQGERRFLLSLDPGKTNVTIGNRKDGFYPVSWVAAYEKGRNFYCSLGHNDHIYWNPAVLRHYLAGIQYALGDLDADAGPNKVPGEAIGPPPAPKKDAKKDK